MAIIKQDGVNGKVCSICNRWKSLDKYYNEKAKGKAQGGKQNVCIACAKKR